MRYIDFVDPEYEPKETDLVCEFHVEPLNQPLEVIAGGVAAESSVGTNCAIVIACRSMS